jgi:pimeloyl-ACP methyl ester carboxylesterase
LERRKALGGCPSVLPLLLALALLSDESAFAISGAELLVRGGTIKDPDAPVLVAEMRAAYDEMHAQELADPRRVRDAKRMWIGPAAGKAAVVFLHGYGGRFALPCWQMARATGVMTACPDVGAEGDWWSKEGERVARAEIEAVRAAGFERVVLAGLSNGAIGVSRLVPRLKVDGVILVSGADPSVAAPGVPALVVQGRKDAMSSAANARAYATKAHAGYVDLDAGHFAFLVKRSEAERAIGAFVSSAFRSRD